MEATLFVAQVGNGGAAVKAGNHSSQKSAGGGGGAVVDGQLSAPIKQRIER